MIASSDKTAAGYMTAATERRLQDAVGTVADLAEAGMDPTDAAVKVASAFRLLPDQLALVCTAYNTGVHASLRKSAGGPSSRASTAPLVDALAAASRSFGAVKTSEAHQPRPAVRHQFVGDPTKTASRSVAVPGAMSAVILKTAQAPRPAPDVTAAERKKTASAADECRLRAERSFAQLTHKIAELATYFRRQDFHVGWEDAWGDSVARHGKVASALFAAAQSLYPDVIRAVTTRPAYVAYDRAPYSIVSDCVKLAFECVDHVDGYVDHQVRLDQLSPAPDPEEGFSDVLKTASKGGGNQGTAASPPSPPPPSPTPPKKTNEPEKGTGGVLSTFAKAWNQPAERIDGVKKLDEGKKQKMYDSTVRALVDPYAMADQRAQQTQTMLTTVIGSDPVISSHHPSKVLAHYNEMAQLAPRLMENPAAVRAMLRQRLESGAGGIDPFQIEQLLKAENEVRKRDDPAYGKGVLDL